MTDEINEIIRVLQLTTYDEDEWDADNLTVMKKALNAMQGKLRTARDWLEVIFLLVFNPKCRFPLNIIYSFTYY